MLGIKMIFFLRTPNHLSIQAQEYCNLKYLSKHKKRTLYLPLNRWIQLMPLCKGIKWYCLSHGHLPKETIRQLFSSLHVSSFQNTKN